METIKFNNNDLTFEVDKILSFDTPIIVSKNVDWTLNYPYILEVEDSSYFYAEEKERDQDFDKLKSII